MLLPGSKGWIKKFFALQEDGKIVFSVKDRVQLGTPEQMVRNIGAYTGLTYGHCNRTLYHKTFEIGRWTDVEIQKVALFESLFEVFRMHNPYFVDNEVFIQKVLAFYGEDVKTQASFLGLRWSRNITEPYAQLEQILNQRLNFPEQRFDFQWWKYSMSNTLVYLDVILFYHYLKGEETIVQRWEEFESGAINGLVAMSKLDGVVSNPEKTILNIYLASSRLADAEKSEISKSLKADTGKVDFKSFTSYPLNVRAFYLDMLILHLFSTNQEADDVRDFILTAADEMGLSEEIFESAESLMQSYLIDSERKSGIFSSKNGYEQVFNSFSKRWTKILLRNKDKLVVELMESKELIALVSKATTKELTDEEKTKVKKQFRDIVKSVPALGIFMLPGGAILLPLILKIIPDLIPSAFRDNEINKG